MFKTPLIAGACLTAFLSAHAQVKVELLLDQKQYLLKESLPVGVRVVNHSGRTLTFSGTNWLSFTVEDHDNFVVKQLQDSPPPQKMSVETSYMATQWIDVGRTFDFSENTSYRLRARVHIDEWNENIFSDPIEFEIVKGTMLWEQQIGIPRDPSQPPEIRKYIVQQANYLKDLQLYVRVTDATEKVVYAVIRLAPMVQISQPEAQIDTLNRLHVLTQIGMRQFMHFCIDPDGHLVLRNTYRVAGRRPKLEVTQDGGVYVNGGSRMLRKDDIPPSPLLSEPLPERPTVTGGDSTPTRSATPSGDGAKPPGNTH